MTQVRSMPGPLFFSLVLIRWRASGAMGGLCYPGFGAAHYLLPRGTVLQLFNYSTPQARSFESDTRTDGCPRMQGAQDICPAAPCQEPPSSPPARTGSLRDDVEGVLVGQLLLQQQPQGVLEMNNVHGTGRRQIEQDDQPAQKHKLQGNRIAQIGFFLFHFTL